MARRIFPKFAGQLLRFGDLGGGHAFGDSFFQVFTSSTPLRGYNAKPRVRARIVFGNAPALGVHRTKVVLRRRYPLLRRLGEPADHLGVVLGGAGAVEVGQTKVGLRRCMPLFSKRLDKAESFLMITRPIRRNAILKIPCHHGRSGEQHEGGQARWFEDKSKAYEFERYLKSGSGRAFAKRHF